jgi:hypothetical protein
MDDLLLWNINQLFDLATGWFRKTGWRRTPSEPSVLSGSQEVTGGLRATDYRRESPDDREIRADFSVRRGGCDSATRTVRPRSDFRAGGDC